MGDITLEAIAARPVLAAADGPDVPARSTDQVLVAIPAYNEERFIGSLILQVRWLGYPVLVIDDGSSDGTAKVAAHAGASVARHEKNLGKAEALNTAFRIARGEGVTALVVLDGDSQHNPAEIEQVLAPVLRGDADVVIGSRYLDASAAHIPRVRSFGQRSMTLATNVSSGTAVTDSQSGFRAFSQRAIDAFRFRSHGFGVEGEMQFQARDYSLQVLEVPITAHYEEPPKRNVVSHGLQVLNSVLRLVERHRPLLFFGAPGVLLIMAGLGFGALVTLTYQTSRVLAVGYGLITVLALLAGLLAIFTGMTLHAIRGTFLDLEHRMIVGPNRLTGDSLQRQLSSLSQPPPDTI
jgi:glycosyltransferase involved in cell wall biosynthesis